MSLLQRYKTLWGASSRMERVAIVVPVAIVIVVVGYVAWIFFAIYSSLSDYSDGWAFLVAGFVVMWLFLRLHVAYKEGQLRRRDERRARRAASPADASNARVFVSYRRADTADVTGRLHDRLVGALGEGSVFMDVDDVPLGVDYRAQIEAAIAQCSVMLVVIGPAWLGRTANRENRLRVDDDPVRLEIETAMRRGVSIIPLLVGGALMPDGAELPESMRSLVYRNALTVRPDPDFDRDMERLQSAIDELPA